MTERDENVLELCSLCVSTAECLMAASTLMKLLSETQVPVGTDAWRSTLDSAGKLMDPVSDKFMSRSFELGQTDMELASEEVRKFRKDCWDWSLELENKAVEELDRAVRNFPGVLLSDIPGICHGKIADGTRMELCKAWLTRFEGVRTGPMSEDIGRTARAVGLGIMDRPVKTSKTSEDAVSQVR